MRSAAAMIAMATLSATTPARAADIYVMRHLEREAGKDPSLNATGAAHAERLAAWFRHDPPTKIYVTDFKRAQETAAPLARRLGVTPFPYDPAKPDAMIASAKAAKGAVLIVGHSNTVPAIVHALGGPPAIADLADDDYGRIWIVAPGGKLRVAKLSEKQPR